MITSTWIVDDVATMSFLNRWLSLNWQRPFWPSHHINLKNQWSAWNSFVLSLVEAWASSEPPFGIFNSSF